jgi:ATP-dependent RNA helicase DeaD
VQGLVLTPTRELAIQVAKAIHDYGRYTDARVLAVYGGQPYGPQIRGLKRGVDIVVGTPGRLLDLIKRGVLDLSAVRTVVLDEADEMLSMGFIEDIEKILDGTPANRQTALFSATMPKLARRLAQKYMYAPQFLQIEKKQLTVAAIEQRYYLVNEKDKLAALTRLFEVEEIESALIFVRTRAGSGELANELAKRGFMVEALNGDLSQDARERVMKRFRERQIKVLVATDVAARGLDIDDISHVFNYDLPDDPEVYVHRVGRTGRAGKTGVALSIVTPVSYRRLGRIEAFARQKIKRASLPSIEDIQKYREGQLLEKVNVWLKRGRCQREREIVAELVEAGNDPIEIAAVALKVARAEEKQRPIPEISEVQKIRTRRSNRDGKKRFQRSGRSDRFERTRGKRSHEDGMVRLMLSRGKAHGVRPNEVVSTIAYHADIPGSTIGKISIHTQHTLVDIPEKYAAKVLAQASNYRLRKQGVSVKLG